MEALIHVDGLQKQYMEGGVLLTNALRGINFSIKRGEFVSIMGPSGSGKSTLLHILSFLDRPTSGTYAFNGKRMQDLTDRDLAFIRNKNMGFVFQSFNLLSRLTVYENIELVLLYSDMPVRERKNVIEKAVAAVGLEEKLHSEAGKLSGGQKQRVAIARALVNNPDVIFADEPTGNLDSKSGGAVMEIFENLNKAGHTIILVTHETYTAQFAKRILFIRDGNLESDVEVSDHNRSKSLVK